MITLTNIKKIYNPKKANEFEALHGVSCDIKDGELMAIIGKSSAVKSTLLHILACIDSYQDGCYCYARPEGCGAMWACHRDIGRGDSLIDKAGDLWYDEDNL